MHGWSGVNVCTSTCPPFSPRPARPATCASNWNVRVHHADECDVGEVEPLRDHLRAHKNLNQPVAEGVEHPLMTAGSGHRVGVHPLAHVARELLLDLRL